MKAAGLITVAGQSLVITSYSIHYTKLYERRTISSPSLPAAAAPTARSWARAADTSKRTCASRWVTPRNTISAQGVAARSRARKPTKSSSARKKTDSCTKSRTRMAAARPTPSATAADAGACRFAPPRCLKTWTWCAVTTSPKSYNFV